MNTVWKVYLYIWWCVFCIGGAWLLTVQFDKWYPPPEIDMCAVEFNERLFWVPCEVLK